MVNPGDEVTIKFDMRGTASAGGVVFAELFSELTGGGTSAAEILGGGPLFPNADPEVWTSYEFTTNVGPDVSGGITLQLNAATGGDPSSVANIFFVHFRFDLQYSPLNMTTLGPGKSGHNKRLVILTSGHIKRRVLYLVLVTNYVPLVCEMSKNCGLFLNTPRANLTLTHASVVQKS